MNLHEEVRKAVSVALRLHKEMGDAMGLAIWKAARRHGINQTLVARELARRSKMAKLNRDKKDQMALPGVA